MIEGLRAIRQNNMSLIEDMTKLLDEEEQTDTQMRQQYQE
jgi:hypothetical protein